MNTPSTSSANAAINHGIPERTVAEIQSCLREQFPGLIQSLSQCLLPGLSAWVEVGGIAPFPCLKALLRQPIST
jgi:hypothetical protein